MTPLKLQKNIMRRVYYAFALRLVTHPLTISAVSFSTGLFLFARMVHVAEIMRALQSMPLGSVPAYVMSALTKGEALTLLSMAVMGIAILYALAYVRHLHVAVPGSPTLALR